jgi:hypothetical protein
MRANGVPDFPDPSPGGGAQFELPASAGGGDGAGASTPAFRTAQARCRALLPTSLPGPGTETHPSAQTVAKLVRIAACMRRHGVPQFPDPTTTFPNTAAGAGDYRVITDFDGAILAFPSSVDLQAPAYRRALTACGAPPLGLPH